MCNMGIPTARFAIAFLSQLPRAQPSSVGLAQPWAVVFPFSICQLGALGSLGTPFQDKVTAEHHQSCGDAHPALSLCGFLLPLPLARPHSISLKPCHQWEPAVVVTWVLLLALRAFFSADNTTVAVVLTRAGPGL